MIKPYYQDEYVTIYNGDCREILPQLDIKVDLVLTDPPYPDYHIELYNYQDGIIDWLKGIDCRQLIFWSAKVDFPLDYTAIHIWDKQTGAGSEYERIFERNGQFNYKVFRAYLINSTVAANYTQDVFYNHPSQKPRKLVSSLVNMASKQGDLTLDPFLGSGTTALAAKILNRKCIGIEIEEKYCEIAAKRCCQSVMKLEL
jgi:site-specific DNA-methyltransferase (adenine-specific)